MTSRMRTRLAPSPTGALHLGNARTFVINWALARQRGWEIVLRIEDLDGPRIKPNADRQAIDVLQWLGLDWDEGPLYQRHDLSRYRRLLDELARAGQIYPCRCTRKQVAAAQSAPHGDDHELRYAGQCRPPEGATYTSTDNDDASTAWRVRVPDEAIEFDDDFAGRQSINVQQQVGDFIVATKASLPAYQLAVTVDDAAQRITHVVRGDDLIRSTPRQMLLWRQLDMGPLPRYMHVPLVLGPDGHRLAKRHGDTRLTTYRKRGISGRRVMGLLAAWCDMGPRREMTAQDFAERFDLARLPRQPIIMKDDDEAWLLDGASGKESS